MYNILPWAKDKSCSLEHNIEDPPSVPNNWMEIAADSQNSQKSTNRLFSRTAIIIFSSWAIKTKNRSCQSMQVSLLKQEKH